MKKLLAKIIVGALALCMLCSSLIACSDSEWKGNVSLKPAGAGEVVSNGGFIAETANYLYFINGVGSSTADNTMGAPLKGALMVVKKDALDKPQVVVPKLFVASDYNAGVFIDGAYVYYGTPNVEKDSSGSVANYEMTFMKTKLDGSGESTELFTLDSLSTEYRIVKGTDNKVYIIYYNAEDSALIEYNVSTGKEKEIAKTDAKAKEESMASYKLLDGEDGINVIYVNNVYQPDTADDDNRLTEKFNKVYAYTAGTGAAEILNGANKEGLLDDTTYAVSLIKDGYIFYTATVNNGTSKTYGVKVAELSDKAKHTEIDADTGAAYVAAANVINALDEVYTIADGVLYKTTMLEKDSGTKTPVADASSINSLLFVKEGYVYYYNSSNQIAKLKLLGANLDEEVNEIRISEDSVSTTWYEPEIIEIAGVEYIFYCDNSAYGKQYVKYVSLEFVENTDTVEEKDDDDKIELEYVKPELIKVLGKMTTADEAAIVTARINALSKDAVKFTATEEDKEFIAEIDKVKAIYDESTKAVKEKVSTDAKNTLKYYAKAQEIAAKYKTLESIKDNWTTDKETLPQELIDAYNAIKKDIEAFRKTDGASKVENMIDTNLCAYYNKVRDIMTAK